MSNNRQKFLISTGILVFFGLVNFQPNTISYEAWIVASLLLLMTFWWLTEAIPLSITAILPLIVIPSFTNVNISDVAKPYANPVIFLLLGGFILGLGFQKSNLHLRFAMLVLKKIGSTKKSILGGIILSTAFLSMWISNTATCLLMLPIVVSILDEMEIKNDFLYKKILLLAIAYSASIGGIATLVGTAPNAIFAGFLMENYNLEINFIDWMKFSLPLVFLLIIILWFFFNFFIESKNIPISKNNFIEDQYKKLGPFSSKEKITMIILLLTIFLWLSKKSINSALSINLTDSSIALFGSLLFFIIPYERYNFVLNKSWFTEIPWNILILFGGGLSLASSINSSGLANLISESLFVFSELEVYLIIILMALLISFMTEITSNTATTLLFLPIVASFASNFDYDLILLCLPIIISASCAFMMPIATPPNAIIFSTNQIKITFMVRIGFVMNCTAVILSSIWIFYFSFLIR